MFAKADWLKGVEAAGFIGKGMHIEGKLSFEDTVRVEGSFRGEINSTGTLVIGEGGHVEGTVNVETIVIAGEVHGTVSARKRVELKAPGKMEGEIRTPNLIITDGAVFNGRCSMTRKDTGETVEVLEYNEEIEPVDEVIENGG